MEGDLLAQKLQRPRTADPNHDTQYERVFLTPWDMIGPSGVNFRRVGGTAGSSVCSFELTPRATRGLDRISERRWWEPDFQLSTGAISLLEGLAKGEL